MNCATVVEVCLLTIIVVPAKRSAAFNANKLPTARIVIHVSKRRAEFWEPWEVNKRICPPSLCKFSDPSARGKKESYRPRGTAGTPFYQGDIVLGKEDERYIYQSSRRKRATMRIRTKLWKDGIIPYRMDPDISEAAERVILRGLQHIMDKTCIKFRKKKPSDNDYIHYISEPGCWSNVGRRGGSQRVSIGRGCENVGTAVHETSHAIGVWHEQARPDREKYIRVVEDNISPRFLPDFKILNKRITTSRGYPYDYTSIMHYNKYAFTRMGEPTIKIIGIGKKLNLKIGQRRELSTIDIAQLREMYHCGRKEDSKLSFCPKGWTKFQTSCYKFHVKPRSQFPAAQKACEKDNSRLVSVESRSEEKFLQRRVNKKYPSIYIWRTGGKRINNTMMWFIGDRSKPKKTKYTNWEKGMPGTFTSMALVKDRSTKTFKWQGVWIGSRSQLPEHAYPFICEKRSKRKCVKGRFKDGRDYRGKLDHTLDGVTCQKWSEQYPHSHKLKPRASGNREDSDGLGDHNYCRNPSGRRKKKPWCFTTKANKEWQYCDITTCSEKKSKNEVNPKRNRKPGIRQRSRSRSGSKRRRPTGRPTQRRTLPKPKPKHKPKPPRRGSSRRSPSARRNSNSSPSTRRNQVNRNFRIYRNTG